MRGDTPPRMPDIDEDDDDMELVDFGDDIDQSDELEEVSLEELEERLGGLDEDNDEEDLAAARPNKADVRNDARLTFSEHKSGVFACTLHPSRPWAATGSEDDTAIIWCRKTGSVLHKITDHKDTVTDVQFNFDGNYLATGDMAGEVFVHKVQECTDDGEASSTSAGASAASAASNERSSSIAVRRVFQYSMGDMSWMFWHRNANVLLAGSDDGEVYVWRIPGGDCKILPGEGLRCETGALTSDGKKLFTAYINGKMKLWDLKNCTIIYDIDGQHSQGHQMEVVTSVTCDRDQPLYASGAEDGKIIFWTNTGPVGAVEANGPVECVAMSPSTDLKLAASGTLQGQIAIWDATKYTLRTLCEHTNENDGITKLKWIGDHTVMAATLEGHLYAYDARSGVQKFELSGHLADVYDFVYDRNENILLSVSDDKTAKIFDISPDLID